MKGGARKVNGGITRPAGFLAGAAHCGIKKKNKDLCLVYSTVMAKAAGVFTTNKIKAAPVIVSRNNLKSGLAQAVIANSGNANCMTGKEGMDDAKKIVQAAASALSLKKNNVLTVSTGIIGKRLPVTKIFSGIKTIVPLLDSKSSGEAAAAIMTTDTVPKETAVSLKIGSKVISIGAIAKGAGMIHPDMATMLALITTDADITGAALKKALRESAAETFNRITVDGDMSTNDCVLILANGLAGNRTIKPSGEGYELFKKALASVCLDMAVKIIKDAEGATKFVKVNIKKARNASDAKMAGYAIATSLLVKTAVYGEDPNWGRVAAALGRSGANFKAGALDLYMGNKKVISKGAPVNVKRGALKKIFAKKDIEISAVLNSGNSHVSVLTGDLSKKYIDINAHYAT
ncbi:MAG: bifunctional glutamate N-acetyltransferase/amino-acid acetyltransferase ArgJ [Candidatus Omnitrophota bacterium]|nr:bifunctional glutamate N-acetyltransferase/amino-acid acetyltransferase ArgJ [Candidatus Omnitrophota bacterium]